MKDQFSQLNFTVDLEKNLYYNKNFIFKLNRNLFKIKEDENNFYLLDKVGDLFTLNKNFLLKENKNLNFIFGILGLPKEFLLYKDFLIVADDFKRIFIYKTNGLLYKIKFFNENIKNIKIEEKIILVELENNKKENFYIENI